MKLRLEVEDYHLRCGTPKSAHHCPLAIALSPRIGGWIELTEDGRVRIYNLKWDWLIVPAMRQKFPFQRKGDFVREFLLPPEAVEYMKCIDAGEKVEPRTFEIDVPEEEDNP